jgi:hypothetical protein
MIYTQVHSLFTEMNFLEAREVFYLQGYGRQLALLGSFFSGDRTDADSLGILLAEPCREMASPILEKGISAINERIKMEEDSEWSRLPLPRDYRHKGLGLLLRRLKKLSLSPAYRAVWALTI